MKDFRYMAWLLVGLVALQINGEAISYSLKENPRDGKFVIQFNDKSISKRAVKKKHIDGSLRKLFGIADNRGRHKRKLIMGMAAGGLGGLAAGAMAAAATKGDAHVATLRNLRQEHRSLEMKNEVEKDNIHLLFLSKVGLAKVFSKIKSIQADLQFTFQKKKDMLSEILPEISV